MAQLVAGCFEDGHGAAATGVLLSFENVRDESVKIVDNPGDMDDRFSWYDLWVHKAPIAALKGLQMFTQPVRRQVSIRRPLSAMVPPRLALPPSPCLASPRLALPCLTSPRLALPTRRRKKQLPQ